MDIIKKLAEELNIGRHQAEAAVKLIDEGNTIPFIARYRKEATGSLNDEVLRNLDERLKYLRSLEDRKSQVIASIAEQEKLTPELELKIKEAQTLVAVEDLYRPYKPKRRTRAMIAREKGLVIKNVDRKKLDFISAGANHQGVAANVPAHEYSSVEEILDYAKSKNEAPFLVICDEIEDSHNLGAIIRTAEACGVHGIIIPKRRNVGLNFIVAKTSCGALEYVKVARVANINATIDRLKKENIWLYAADMKGQLWSETDFSGGAALVIGSEGKGLGAHIKENCDVMVSLPMKGRVNSLNASVAAGIIMYEIARQRL